MDTEKIIRKKLKLIKKKGDLYDVISNKKNATPETLIRKLVKAHTLVFSRLLYLFLVSTRRLKNSFSPVNKIKNAQDTIREYVGLPIDIIKTKDILTRNRDKKLGVLYGNYNANLDEYDFRPQVEDLEEDLKTIYAFCSRYNIDEIFISEFFLNRYLSKEFLKGYEHLYHSEILDHRDTSVPSYLYIKTDVKGIKNIILKLDENKYDNEYIYSFKDKIKDQRIKDAIDTFQYDNDAEKLLLILKSRLSSHINDEGISKDREYGKIYTTYELGGPYLKMIVLDKMGNQISNSILSLYSYLEVTNFKELEKKANILSDNQEIKLMALLYLHLLGEERQEEMEKCSISSIYDYIYEEYEKANFNQKIPWIRTKLQKIEAEIPQLVLSFYSVMLSFIIALLAKFIPNHLPISGPWLDRYNSFCDGVESAFGDSYKLEKNLFNRFKQTVEKYLPNDMKDELLNYSQREMELEDSSPKKVAEIEWIGDQEMPVYFASSYAERARFYNGELNFDMKNTLASFYNLSNCRPLFLIKLPLSKEDFADIDDESFFHLPLGVCPIGDDYALTQIIIQDESDGNKSIKIDEQWYDINLWDLTSEEKEIFKSMENPMVHYIYGLKENCSQLSFDDRNYTDLDEAEIREAILRGLNLDSSASSEDINMSIASKEYTKHPLYVPTSKTEELEYYEEIASLDSIDINLAAVLTTMGNEGFVYTVGYKNSNEDNCISTDEAYVWAMNEDGEIIDFLSYFAEEGTGGSANNASTNTSEEWANNEENSSNNISQKSEEQENDLEESKDSENSEESKEKEETNDTEDIEDTKKDNDTIKEVLNKIRLWALEHHIPYYLTAILAVLIINRIFGRKIKLKLKFNKTYRILNDDNLAHTYADLLKYIYGQECVPIKRSKSDMLDLICREFQSFSEEDVQDLLVKIKSEIKESENPKALKRVEELLGAIPFAKERKNALNKKLTLKNNF